MTSGWQHLADLASRFQPPERDLGEAQYSGFCPQLNKGIISEGLTFEE